MCVRLGYALFWSDPVTRVFQRSGYVQGEVVFNMDAVMQISGEH